MRTAPFAIALLATAAALATPASAKPLPDQPIVHLDYSAQWDPQKLTATIRSQCQIPMNYFRTERDYDGKVHINQSPSVTKEQSVCARRIIAQQKLEIRGETLPADWSRKP